MRILVLDSEFPFPAVTGGKSRTFHLLKSLSAEHELTLACFSPDSSETRPVCPFPLETISVPYELPEIYKRMHSLEWESAYGQLSSEEGEPWFVSWYNSPAMEDLLRGVRSRPFDLILIEHTFMARFLPVLPPDVPKILDLHNVHTLMAWRRAQASSGEDSMGTDEGLGQKEFERTRSFEKRVCDACQLCLCCSEEEAQAARAFLNIRHSRVIPNGADTIAMTPCKGAVTPGYLLFTGVMNYAPNVEAVRYFAAEILPLIQAEVPGVTFHIAGSRPAPEVRALASGSVFIHGSVPDMRAYFQQACVVVVPLLQGGGTRLKILDAAACGKPIVSTSLGAEGLDFVNGRDLILADSPPGFAQAVGALLADAKRRSELSQGARRAAEQYEWLKIGSQFRASVREFARVGARG